MPGGASAKADCPRPSPSRLTTYARTLHRACVIVGGVAPLARHFGVSAIEIILLQLDQAGAA